MKSIRPVLAFAVLAFASSVAAESMGPRSASELHPSFATEKRAQAPISLHAAARLDLPPLSMEKADTQDARRQVVGHGRMFAAEGITAPKLGATKRAQTVTVIVTSPNAASLRVGLRITKASGAAAIRVAPAGNPTEVQAVHPEQLQAAVGSILWTPPTIGEAQVVELAGGEGELQAELVGVSHIFASLTRTPAKAVGDALSCQIDVACVSNSTQLDATTKAAFNAKVNSTALMVITTSTGQTATCTGSLLNNDYRVPLFLSAQHCVGDTDEANNLATVWGFQSATCGGPAPPTSALAIRTGGALLYGARQDLDQSIMALRDSPPSTAVLSGWSASNSSRTGEVMLGMHHPRGDLKKTSLGTINGISGAFSIGSTNYPANHFYLTGWQIGLVESGSSGSGIFIQPAGEDYLALVGVLNSGPATGIACAGATTYTNRYGRLSSFFPVAQKFLQNDYTPNYTDLWWNPSESGWGINLQHQGEIIFATWFTYDADGSGMWLVMSNGERVGTSTYQGTLYRPRGTPFNQINGSQAVETPLPAVGTATLTFSGTNSATFAYTVNGVSGSKQVQRQVFSTRPTCEFNLANRGAATNYQDLWWNSDESGWGVNLTHQGDILFATWFTYDQNRAGMWLVMSNGVKTGPASFRGDLYRTTGRPFNQINGTPAVNLPLTPVGTLSFDFTDGFTGTMSYTVNGASGAKVIRRQIFAYPNTVCR